MEDRIHDKNFFFSLEKKVLKIVHTSVRSFWMLCPPFPMTAPASFKY